MGERVNSVKASLAEQYKTDFKVCGDSVFIPLTLLPKMIVHNRLFQIPGKHQRGLLIQSLLNKYIKDVAHTIAQACFLCPVWVAGNLLVGARCAPHPCRLQVDQNGPLPVHQQGKDQSLGRIHRSSRTPLP